MGALGSPRRNWAEKDRRSRSIASSHLWGLLPDTSLLPSLSILPAHINRVIQVQQQTFASIEKAQAKKVVVDEGGQRIHHNISHKLRQRAAGLAATHRLLCP